MVFSNGRVLSLLKMSQRSVDTGSVPYQTWCHITGLTVPVFSKEKQNLKKARVQYSNYSAGYVEFLTTHGVIASVPIRIYIYSMKIKKDPFILWTDHEVF